MTLNASGKPCLGNKKSKDISNRNRQPDLDLVNHLPVLIKRNYIALFTVWEATVWGPPDLDLIMHLPVWGATVCGATVWGQPDLDLVSHLPVLLKNWGATVWGATVWGATV